jgi:TonB family protein
LLYNFSFYKNSFCSKMNFKILLLLGFAYFSQSHLQAATAIDTLPAHDNYPLNVDEASKVYVIADRRPEFPGGGEKLGKYLADNMKYPSTARSRNIKGLVIISFVVCKDGYLRDIKIQKGLGFGCDEEAVRLIAGMNNLPNRWTPGVVNGKPANIRYTLPLKFKW